MKSLVLKDLFNIGHNAKSMLFILVVFAVALIPFSGVEGYIFVCAILCSMMIVTTFSFDDSSKWTRYAMIMPVSKKELVAGKFMVLALLLADNRFSVFVNQGTNTPASSKLCHKVIDPGFSVHYHIKAFHTSCGFSNFKSSASHIDTSQ